MTRAASVDNDAGKAENEQRGAGVTQVGLQQLFGGGGGPGSTHNDEDDDRSSICSVTSMGSMPGMGAKSTMSHSSKLSDHSQQLPHHPQQHQQHQQQQARLLSHHNLEQHQHGVGNVMSPLDSPTESALADFADLPDSASVVCMQSSAPSAVASLNSHAPTHRNVDDERGLPGSFVCKVTDEGGRMFRIRLTAMSGSSVPTPYPVRALREAVAAEAGLQDASPACFTLKYVDDDGDEVTLSSDEGLADAVRLAAACEWKALKICLSRPGAGTTASAQIRPDSTKVTRRAGMSGSTAGIAAAVLAVLGIGGFMALRGSATTFDGVPAKQR